MRGLTILGALHPEFADLRDVLRADALAALAREAAGRAPDFPLANVDYLPTIPNPEKGIT